MLKHNPLDPFNQSYQKQKAQQSSNICLVED